MKKMIVSFIILLLPILMLSACTQPAQTAGKDTKISIVCTIFPPYDWARQILGSQTENMNITFLLDNRIDLHNFQPSVDDMITISTCDLFIYVGGESDGWVEDALAGATNKNMHIINLLETLGDAAKEEETLEGMEEEDDDDDEENNSEDEIEYDEHVWLSLKNAQIFCTAIADTLSLLDPYNASAYKNNLSAYIEKLKALDQVYLAAVNEASIKSLLFGDRFPFRYLMDDYGLTPYAAFSGCSAETEASFETIIFLADKVDELALNTVMVTESADQSIARTIISNTARKDQQILVLDALQSVSKNDVQNGQTYLSIMEENLKVLKEATK